MAQITGPFMEGGWFEFNEYTMRQYLKYGEWFMRKKSGQDHFARRVKYATDYLCFFN